MYIRLLTSVMISCFTVHVYAQNKPKDEMKVNNSRNEITIESPHALKVIQKGQGNKVIAEQANGITVIEGSAHTKIIRNGSNEISYTQSDSAGNRQNSSVVQQSGNGNSVIIRQNGTGNKSSVSQSGNKKD